MNYNHASVENKWQKRWCRNKTYKADDLKPNKFYLLVELAYTSGDLHIGHWFAFSAPDAFARFKRMQGNNVLFPVGGFDAFGLPAENAAITHGVHPKAWTYQNIDNMRKQFAKMGPSFDWGKEVVTCDPDYYKWTQWLFLKLFENGLAYRDKVWSNWCPDCKTVLANEHVVNGCCWRHTATKVVQKEVPQWLFAITRYADKLIWPPDSARDKPKVDWPKEAREGQNNWIGRSEGIEIKFQIHNSKFIIPVFTTRPDTIFGATFIVLSPEHPLALKITTSGQKQKVSEYISRAEHKLERERLEEAREKTGVFTGSYAKNPISGKLIPIWVADFVLTGYGTGAIMGVPAHDERDWNFAKAHDLPVVEVVKGGNVAKSSFAGEGKLVNSAKYSGIPSEEARKKISNYIIYNHLGERKVQYHLRDWTISRQRYWGAPIPIVYCDKCGTVPVPEKDLPVVLPENIDFTPKGKPPLAWAEDWVKVKCPKCGGDAKREVETMDTYVDSSWYFLRYPSPKYGKGFANPKSIKEWLPAKVYFGGPEHILGHTLYARFITKVLHDLGYLPFDEFSLVRKHHGVILGPDGYRMSKSRGNVVNPDEQLEKYGADAVRMYLCFLGPHEKGGTWELEGIEGMSRFLNRVWTLVNEYGNIVLSEDDSKEVIAAQHKTVQKVTKYLESFRFNVAIAKIMEFVNLLYGKEDLAAFGKGLRCDGSPSSPSRAFPRTNAAWRKSLHTLVKLLAPFAPHMTEELWVEVLGQKFSIHTSDWPKYDTKLVREIENVIVVQVNGRLRGQLVVNDERLADQGKIEEMAKENSQVGKWLKGKTVKKVIFVQGKLINFVTN